MSRFFGGVSIIVLLVITGIVIANDKQQLQQQDQQQDQQNRAKLDCKLFQIHPEQRQLTVIAGNFERSGSKGDQQQQEDQKQAKRYRIRIGNQTNLHWQGKEEKLSLDQLMRINQENITVPMTVYYSDVQGRPTEDNAVFASEIVLRRQSENPESQHQNENK